ncbi:hypothetical protein GCM10011583_09390 [Streptomyces camponoticapitis]|uniref:Uncharacterized protein n=1 Tax=Streptomyces camponoticapitis TaxID=1616125 RepID=A0ABQ2DYR8_9ACTN|nr:hypothetical protein GCM10011583_09390 [Streptomyces camponoticapitis]
MLGGDAARPYGPRGNQTAGAVRSSATYGAHVTAFCDAPAADLHGWRPWSHCGGTPTAAHGRSAPAVRGRGPDAPFSPLPRSREARTLSHTLCAPTATGATRQAPV